MASFCKNWPTGFKSYWKQKERMAHIYWKWAMFLNKREILLPSLLMGGTVFFWAYRKPRPLSRWAIIGVGENKSIIWNQFNLGRKFSLSQMYLKLAQKWEHVEFKSISLIPYVFCYLLVKCFSAIFGKITIKNKLSS